jgi:hypothetical protein
MKRAASHARIAESDPSSFWLHVWYRTRLPNKSRFQSQLRRLVSMKQKRKTRVDVQTGPPSSIQRLGGTGVVFCDEAGFTGNNLLDREQEVFVFAGAAIGEDRAREIVERIVCDFRLNGAELKGSRLMKTNCDRRAVTALLKSCAEQVRLVSHLKKFALACKFFEQIFEPPLAEQNSIFYGCGFHSFISNLLFLEFRAKTAPAEAIFEDFYEFMTQGKMEALERIFPQPGLVVDCTSNPLAAISLFAMINRSTIQAELDIPRPDGSPHRWVLDLTTTSLFSVLRHWGEMYDEIDVFCDKSKPLEAEIDFLRVMVGRRDHLRMQMFGKDTQFTFNLVREPAFVDSAQYPGVQIADVFASSVARAWQQQYWGQASADEKEWLGITKECHLDDNVWPDLDAIDLRTRAGFVNASVLHELTERCVRKENLFRGMPEFIAAANATFPEFLRNTEARELGSGIAESTR